MAGGQEERARAGGKRAWRRAGEEVRAVRRRDGERVVGRGGAGGTVCKCESRRGGRGGAHRGKRASGEGTSGESRGERKAWADSDRQADAGRGRGRQTDAGRRRQTSVGDAGCKTPPGADGPRKQHDERAGGRAEALKDMQAWGGMGGMATRLGSGFRGGQATWAASGVGCTRGSHECHVAGIAAGQLAAGPAILARLRLAAA